MVKFENAASVCFSLESNASPWQMVAVAAHLEAMGKQGIAEHVAMQRMKQAQQQRDMAQVKEMLEIQ